MNKLISWLCHKFLQNELEEKYSKLLEKVRKYDNQFKPENALVGVGKLKDFEPDLLKALLQELKSTKNALLIEEKRYSDPIEIAYRD
jgi:hypothetical protein